jgi:hypothetical protein
MLVTLGKFLWPFLNILSRGDILDILVRKHESQAGVLQRSATTAVANYNSEWMRPMWHRAESQRKSTTSLGRNTLAMA